MGILSKVLKESASMAKKEADKIEKIVKDNNLKVRRVKPEDKTKQPNPKNILDKMNAGQTKAYNLIKQSLPGKKLMLYSGSGGVGVGVVLGTSLGMQGRGYKKTDAKTTSNGRINPKDFPVYKKGTDSAKAFQKAFKNAKDKKQKTFPFEGRLYNTKTKQ